MFFQSAASVGIYLLDVRQMMIIISGLDQATYVCDWPATASVVLSSRLEPRDRISGTGFASNLDDDDD